MLVPSLSWQNVRFYIEMAQKCRFLAPLQGEKAKEENNELHRQEAKVRLRKCVFLRCSILKMIVLPRQARDTHRESTQNNAFIGAGRAREDHEINRRLRPLENIPWREAGAKNTFVCPT
jgi:hypothetical protein